MATSKVARDTGSTPALDASTVRRWVQRTCEAQGVPVAVTDPSVLARIVVLLGAPSHGHTSKAVA